MKLEKLIIAEIGSVHDGSFGNAMNLIESAAKHGANCVKFQTHIAEAESLLSAPNPIYFTGEPRFEYFKRTSFSVEQWIALRQKAEDCNVELLSSPFSLEAVDLLEEIGISAYKIPSGEITNTPLIEKIAEIGKPVIVSSGMSNWEDLDNVVNLLKENCDLAVMQCSSIYPCPNEKVGLNIINEIRNRYNCVVGFSDHTVGIAASISSAALGATIIEKHFTFSKQMYGSDAKNSMEPLEFNLMCNAIRDVWVIMDNPIDKNDILEYKEMKLIFQKSIVSKEDLSVGTVLKKEHMAFKKPGSGIEAKNYKELIGKKLTKSFVKDEMFTLDFLE